jgi:hypothetical protein
MVSPSFSVPSTAARATFGTLYRFWIENELRHALRRDESPVTS